MTCPRCGWRMGEWLDGDWYCMCGHIVYSHPPLPWVKDVRMVSYTTSLRAEERRRRYRKKVGV